MAKRKMFGNNINCKIRLCNKYVLLFITIFTVTLCIGTKFILSKNNASTITSMIIINNYKSKISGDVLNLITEYIWKFLLVFLLIYISLYSKIGYFIIGGLPFFYGLYVGCEITSLIIYFDGSNIKYLIFGVYLSIIIHSILYMTLYIAVIIKNIQIYSNRNQSIVQNRRGLSILGYLVVCLIEYIIEIIVYSFIY